MTRTMATLMLLCAAFFWGAGNVANKSVLSHVEPLTAVSLRCAFAALVIAPLALRDFRSLPDGAWARSAAGVAVLFSGAMALQQFAFESTTVTNVSFLVNTCSIMTPVIAWLFLSELPERRIVLALIITLGGVFLMTGAKLSFAALNQGDLASLGSAVIYAGWMVALGHHAVKHGRPFGTCLVQFVVAAVFLLPASHVFESPALASILDAWREFLFLCVFSTGVAFTLQTYAQRYVSSSTAATLVSAECVFGAAGGYLAMGERMSVAGALGAALILAGIAVAAAGDAILRSVPLPIWLRGPLSDQD